MGESAADWTYRGDIDGLRALAVLSVIFYHAGAGLPNGYLGVDVFFVISGYLIVGKIYRPIVDRSFSSIEFYERRIRRLYPAMFAMLLATTLWSMSWLIAPDLEDYAKSLIASISHVSNIYFYITDTAYFVEAAQAKPLLHTWSLGVEEQFYLAGPLALWIIARTLPPRAHLPAIVMITLASFALTVWKPPQGSPSSFYLLPARAWEFGLGAALALSPSLCRARAGAQTAALLGIGAMGFALLSSPLNGIGSVWQTVLATAGAAAVLASGIGPPVLVHRLLALAPLTFIGKISYSLYLWHWPVLVAFGYGAATSLTPSRALLAVAVSAGLAAASWKWVEQPVRMRRWPVERRRVFGTAGLASLLAVATGFALLAGGGFPQRHPELNPLLDARDRASAPMDCFLLDFRWDHGTPLCVRGARDRAPSFVLVGDSHAHVLSAALFDAARARVLAGVEFAAPGFEPLHGLESRSTDETRRLVPLFEEYLRRHPQLRTVIVTAFWSYAATGENYREGPKDRPGARVAKYGVGYHAAAFQKGLERLAATFPERRIIVLDDVPFGAALDPVQHARQKSVGRATTTGALSRATADAQRATYEPILKRVAASYRNVTYIPIFTGLCGPDICPLLDGGGNPLYFDGDHLSVHGAAVVRPALDQIFTAVPR